MSCLCCCIVLSVESCSCLAGGDGINSSLAGAALVVVLGGTISLTTLDAQVVLANVAVVAAAGVGDSSSVTIVVVNGDKVRGHAAGTNVLNHNLARAVRPVVGAVTAAAVELSRVGNSVVADRDATTAIVLDNLVVSTSGTAALNQNVTCSKSRNSVYLC